MRIDVIVSGKSRNKVSKNEYNDFREKENKFYLNNIENFSFK